MESIKKFEVWACPMVYAVFGIMVWWAIHIAGGLGPIYSQPSKFHSFGDIFWVFIGAVTGIIGIWATFILNIPDFTRIANHKKNNLKVNSWDCQVRLICLGLSVYLSHILLIQF